MTIELMGSPPWQREKKEDTSKAHGVQSPLPEWLVKEHEFGEVDFATTPRLAHLRVLMTGSRDWKDRKSVRSSLRKVMKRFGIDARGITLIHGAARGADLMAAEIAKDLGMTTEAHPADWKTHNDNCPEEDPGNNGCWKGRKSCKRAGFRRNQEMVDSGAEVLLAFIRNGSAGATGTLGLWEKTGKPAIICRQEEDGPVLGKLVGFEAL